MLVRVGSPVTYQVIDPLGRVIGEDPLTGKILEEIPDVVFVVRDDQTEPSLVIVTSLYRATTGFESPGPTMAVTTYWRLQ